MTASIGEHRFCPVCPSRNLQVSEYVERKWRKIGREQGARG
jgi:hypothetical protein